MSYVLLKYDTYNYVISFLIDTKEAFEFLVAYDIMAWAWGMKTGGT